MMGQIIQDLMGHSVCSSEGERCEPLGAMLGRGWQGQGVSEGPVRRLSPETKAS